MPSIDVLVGGGWFGVPGSTYSRMLDSEGWATMKGGGLLIMFWYSRVS